MRIPRATLRCRAPHPNPWQPSGKLCDHVLASGLVGRYEFVRTARHRPERPGGEEYYEEGEEVLYWLPCGKKNCRMWNCYRAVPLAQPPSPQLPAPGVGSRV